MNDPPTFRLGADTSVYTLFWGRLFQPIPAENGSLNLCRGSLSLYFIVSYNIRIEHLVFLVFQKHMEYVKVNSVSVN